MKASKVKVQRFLEPYLYHLDDMVFMHQDKADDAMNALMEVFENIYVSIEAGEAQNQKFVATSISRSSKTKYAEYYIR